ncbi:MULTISPECIES: hypothetical protein [Aquitalea]|uniref:hypothetical protein n=1 Tax=Aquitalea TaxID=407217 RepID=UPI000F59CC3B|nr:MULTISPECIES: hypothetical protein [Aquitalea]
MSITRDDKLAQIFGGDKTNSRFENWLWIFLNILNPRLNSDEYGPKIRKKMADILESEPQFKTAAVNYANNGFLPDVYLTWITDDERQVKWLTGYFCSMLNYNKNLMPTLLTGRNRVISLIDALNTDNRSKLNIIESAKSAWNIQQEKDRIFDWFKNDEEDDERCQFAWTWIRDHTHYQIQHGPAVRSIPDLIQLFEQIAPNEDWIELSIEKIKVAWRQRKYRQNMIGKKQYNFVLSENTVYLLDGLSKKYDLTRAEIIEVLIKAEAEKETYISEKIRKRSILLD